MTESTRVCVVGGGPCGLTATKTLREAGLEVDCFELSSAIGGHWVFDNPNGRSSVYRSMDTNTLRRMNRFSDFEMPEDWPPFPSHAQMRAWLEAYVDRFGFRSCVHLRHEVVRAEAVEPSGWRVEVRDANGNSTTRAYDALIAASGYIWSPRMPDVQGAFEGTLLHSQSYRDPTTPVDIRGRSVVVAGIGNTGCELACEIAKAGAQQVFLSARSGTWILPKWEGGRPAAEAAPMAHPDEPLMPPFNWIPERWRQRAFVALATLMLRRSAGPRMRRLQELGLPPAPRNPLAKRPTVNDELPDALESGAVRARPGLSRFEGNEVVFTDGRRERADVVICATGYHLEYPYLDAALLDPEAEDLCLFQGTMHPKRHDLFFVGVSRPMGAVWPMAEVHARFAAALLSGRYALPADREVERRAQWILTRPFGSPGILGASARAELVRGEHRARKAVNP